MPDLEKNYKALQALSYRKKFWRMEFFEPYDKQKEFFRLGVLNPERLLMAGNQLGKTLAGSYECACHLTGFYPEWWEGRRWARPVKGVAAGESSLLVRDVQQRYLCGEAGVDTAFGTGMIPKDMFADKPSMARGVTDAYDTIQVKHASGGVSVLRFKSYEQGREKFQGETLDFFWDDEEPPLDVYLEQLTRISASNGIAYTTFTPMKGGSKTVELLKKPMPGRTVILMTVDDAPHMTPEKIIELKNRYPVYQHKTRLYGVPMAGEGAVFEIAEEAIMEPPVAFIPEEWVKIWGIDFGIGHPFAACLLLWDKDADCIHVHAAVRMVDEGQGSLPVQHAKAMKAVAGAVPVAWPQDGTQREKSSGRPLSSYYKAEGLWMLPDPATWEDGSVSTEAGILEMQDRMTSGRFKVAAHLSSWFEEFRMYHRKDGQIVKERDDLMSATRVAVMMKRFARHVTLGATSGRRKPRSYFADGTEPNAWGE